jgi:hypothetical protein
LFTNTCAIAPRSAATFPVARLLMCIAVMPYFMLAFKMHMSNSYLGPKIVMIRRMVGCFETLAQMCDLQCWDLGVFLTVMIVFIAAYSVPATALLNKHVDRFYWGIFWDLFNVGIWDIFGDINMDAKKGKASGAVHLVSEHCCTDGHRRALRRLLVRFAVLARLRLARLPGADHARRLPTVRQHSPRQHAHRHFLVRYSSSVLLLDHHVIGTFLKMSRRNRKLSGKFKCIIYSTSSSANRCCRRRLF